MDTYLSICDFLNFIFIAAIESAPSTKRNLPPSLDKENYAVQETYAKNERLNSG